MSTLGDIGKLLEQIPLWKRLKSIPGEVDELRTRLEKLENAIAERPALENCPICGAGNLKVKTVRDHPTFGAMGIQERTMQCDDPNCGHTEQRMHDPLGLTKK